MEIYWDLDGVLRDLNKMVYGYDPPGWNYPHPESGEDFLTIINRDFSILSNAPPTEYLSIALQQYKIHIATCQYPGWWPHTLKWIDAHLPKAVVHRFGGWAGLQKTEFVRGRGILIEDSPRLRDYRNVWLIDRPYNRECNAPIRITSPDHLREMIDTLNHLVP